MSFSRCPERVLATSGVFKDLLENHINLTEQYDLCKVDMDTLIDLINTLEANR